MNLNDLLHDPTWGKVHIGIALGSCGALVLVVMRVMLARNRKPELHKPASHLADTYNGDQTVESEPPAQAASHSKGGDVTRRRRMTIAALCLFSIIASCVGYAFALRNYMVLSNWAEGERMDYVGDHVSAIISYKKALKVDPTLRNTHLLIGVALFRSGRIRASIPELQAASKGETSDPTAMALLGDAYQALNRPDEAVVTYLQAAKLAPGEVAYRIVIASLMERLKRPNDAYTAYKQALRIDPNSALAHVRLGVLLLNNGRMEEGMANCKNAVMLAPNSVLAHHALATAYAQEGNLKDALPEYRKAIDLNPKFVLAHFDLGLALEQLNQPETAMLEFTTCTKLTPRDFDEKLAIHRSKLEIRRLKPQVKRRL